jgi:hypothetical protein
MCTVDFNLKINAELIRPKERKKWFFRKAAKLKSRPRAEKDVCFTILVFRSQDFLRCNFSKG